jgi:hypothetical protein
VEWSWVELCEKTGDWRLETGDWRLEWEERGKARDSEGQVG